MKKLHYREHLQSQQLLNSSLPLPSSSLHRNSSPLLNNLQAILTTTRSQMMMIQAWPEKRLKLVDAGYKSNELAPLTASVHPACQRSCSLSTADKYLF
jgi:hypothetical protein